MKNIHLFETKEAYESAKSGLILPRLSYIKNTKDVKYNPIFDANGHKFVEIAGIKWATKNVEAQSETDYGLYFQWGDTQGYTADKVGTGEGQKAFNSGDYNSELSTKYDKSGMTLALEDDAVNKAWGGSWRMPKTEEFQKLGKAVSDGKVSSAFTTNEGVNGLLLTDNADSSKTLFFPACGSANFGSMDRVGSKGYYWSSSLYSSDINYAYSLVFRFNNDVYLKNFNDRYYGFAVRGVLGEN